MKDHYPDYPNIPPGVLVAPENQPDYLDVPGVRLADDSNLAAHIVDQPERADQVAAIHHEGGTALTFGDLARLSAQLANVLAARGIRPGERVAYRSSNRPEALIISLACWRLGAIVVPTPLQARASELRFLLNDTRASILIAYGKESAFEAVPEALQGADIEHRIVFGAEPSESGWESWDALLERAAPTYSGPAISPDSLALIWHTGGTTGVPKACYHTQRRFLAGGYSFGQTTGSAPGQRWAAAAPLGHALGFIYHTIFTLLHGASVVLVEEFSRPEVMLTAIAEHKVDTFTAIAATWAGFMQTMEAEPSLDRLDSLRRAYAMWQSASSTEVSDAWKARGLELMNNFGSTAFATWILCPRAEETFPRTSLGKPAPGYEIIAIDPESRKVEPLPRGQTGRLTVRGATGLTYWDRHEAQARDVVDGWTLVDDLIRFEESGNAMYLGRTDFMISSAGYKIAPVEVEEVLARHAAVREVAVIGLPDPIRQEVVAAYVALKAGVEGSQQLKGELQNFVKAELAPYKYPRRIEFIERLPRDAVGKVQPRLLRDQAPAADTARA